MSSFSSCNHSPRKRKGSLSLERSTIGSSKPGNQKNWEGKGHLEDVRNEIDQLSKAHEEVRATIADSVMAALAKRLTDYIKAYEQAKRERNLLDFNDLLMFHQTHAQGTSAGPEILP